MAEEKGVPLEGIPLEVVVPVEKAGKKDGDKGKAVVVSTTAPPGESKQPSPSIQTQKKKKDKKKFLKKKGRPGVAVRGEHLQRLMITTKLNRQQILEIATKFYVFAPSGFMDQSEFNKALEFDKNDPFATRLFYLFASNKSSEVLSMDDFIIGLSRVAPEADINVKLDLCYELFDRDESGTVLLNEFREVAKYSMKHGRFGIQEEKLNKIVEAQWRELDISGDNEVSRDEFVTVLRNQKEFVNSLTLQVKWLQDAFKRKPLGNSGRDYLDSEPIEHLVTDVALQLNATDVDIKKWIVVLHHNLYFDVKSLREISSQDWASMDLPRRLYTSLQQALDRDHQSSSNIIEGQVKHYLALSLTLHEKILIYLEFHKSFIFFMTLYVFANGAMLTWTLTKYLTTHIGQQYYDQQTILGASFVISRCCGALIKFNFAILLFPVCYRLMTWLRSSVFEHILPIDTAMNFHRKVGVFIFLLGVAHMVAHCVNFRKLSEADSLERVNAAFGFDFTSPPTQAELHASRTGITGWLIIGFMLLLVIFAVERIRRANFKLFFGVHHLYIPIVICLVAHDGFINSMEIIYWMIPVFVVFLCERALTVYRGIPKYEALEDTKVLKGDVLALVIKKPIWFKYSAGHYLWINCPSIDKFEWHPFTLTSSPDENFLMVDINAIGDWTKKLLSLYGEHLSNSPERDKKQKEKEAENSFDETLAVEVMVPIVTPNLPPLRVDGPYGTASSDVLLFTHVVLIGGGIGVTPFISILKSIRYAVLYTNNCPLHAVHFVWVTKTQENFQWFSMMLSELEQHEDLRGFLRISIYLTGPRHPINDIRLLGVSLLMNKAKEEFNEDLVTGLESKTHFGRPDFGTILMQHNQEWAGNDVGVFFCGPEPLAQAVRVTCRALNRANSLATNKKAKKKGATFYFKQEHF